MDVGLLGSGHIARALAQGWSRPQIAARERPRLHFYDLVEHSAADLARECGGEEAASATELVAAARMVVLAVRPRDVVLSVNGAKVQGPDQLRDEILKHRIGDTITLTIQRDTQQLQAPMVAGRHPGFKGR